jgi:hypothetical protein
LLAPLWGWQCDATTATQPKETTMTTTKTGFRVVNKFHGFEKFTTSEMQVKKLVRDSKPSDCTSATLIYRVADGETIGRVDFNNGKLCDM